jgi:biotin carboxylase
MIRTQPLLMSVGAGSEQIATIVHAQRMGYPVLAVDGNPGAPGLLMSDESVVLDIRDEEAVVSVARHHGVAATLPVPIGRLLTTQGAVNDSLGLRGVTRSAALNCTDKALFHACLRKAGLTVPEQIVYAGVTELRRADGSRWPFPAVMKPIHGSGSQGVMVIPTVDDWTLIRDDLDDSLYDQGVLVQSFVNGIVLGLDGAMQDGRAILTLVREKEMTPWPWRVELTHRAPARLPASARDSITESLQTALVALGVNGSVFHADAIWTVAGELVLIELSARPAGVMITSTLVPECTGIDFLAEAIRLHVGGDGRFASSSLRPSLLHYWNHCSGVVKRAPTVDELRKLPGVVQAEIGLHAGQYVQTPKSIKDLIGNGYLLVSGGCWSDVQATFDQARSLFEIEPSWN